ncbi:MAG: biopolymer transporter ExbD [Spirochaetaceae bacterium]|nr:biopolymer transporter ExbD [Spirochaetaceae bacterium]MBQ4554615.1 biopolymer transporter ExbD [Spirochaetaceae bacterium]MBQ8353689.1 biopolymer transporter ExbD [Spirochaetaceae bacterium]
MRKSRRRGSGRSAAQVDLVPMIDIVFQLILFFLVSTTFAMLPGISLNLPESTTSEGVSSGGITITMKEDGQIWYKSTQVDLESLNRELAAFDQVTYEERAEYPINLEADSLVTNGQIVTVFDILRQNGFSAVNLRTTE